MAKKKASTGRKKAVEALTLRLTLNDLKRITAGGSSFGGDTWQQVKWGKIEVALDPIQARPTVAARKRAKKKAAKTTKG